MKIRTLLPLAALLASASSAHAALIAYEGFNYSSGSQSGLSGGTGWTGAWSSDLAGTPSTLNIAPSGLSQGSLSGTGLSLSNTGAVSFRQLDTAAAAAVASQSSSAGDIWISFVGSSTGSFGGITLWNAGSTDLTDANANYNVVLGRNSFDGGNWSWSDITSVGAGSASGVAASTQVLYVMHFDYLATNATAQLFLFNGSNPGAIASLSDATYTGTAATITDASGNRPVFDRLRISGNVLNLDEIRIGTTFADVVPTAVPEPTTYGLMGAGALAAVALVRRRRKA